MNPSVLVYFLKAKFQAAWAQEFYSTVIPFNVSNPQNNPDIYLSKNLICINALCTNCPISKPDSYTTAIDYMIFKQLWIYVVI